MLGAPLINTTGTLAVELSRRLPSANSQRLIGEIMEHDDFDNLEHQGFALYGFLPSPNQISEVYQWALKWFTLFGCSPDLAGGDLLGKSDGSYKEFHRFDRRIRAQKFAGMTHWMLLDVPDELFCDPNGQLRGEAMAISFGIGRFDRSLVFHLREGIIHQRIDDLLEAAREACEILHPKYGIVYRRPFDRGPSLYGLGMQQNGSFHVDDDNMGYWCAMMNHDAFTLLRSVYLWNFLTAVQLELVVENVLLKDWIEMDPSRGKLCPFTSEVMLWTVSSNDIMRIRNELWDAGIILDRKRHFEIPMKEFHVDEDAIAESYKSGNVLFRRPSGAGVSEQQVMNEIIGKLCSPDSQMFKVDKDGDLKSISNRSRSKPK